MLDLDRARSISITSDLMPAGAATGADAGGTEPRAPHRADRPARRRQVDAGRRSRALLGAPFIEIDKMVEREHGAPVATLFEVYGQGGLAPLRARVPATHCRGNESARDRHRGRHRGGRSQLAQLLDRTHAVPLLTHAGRAHAPRDGARRLPTLAENRAAMNDLVAILAARAAAYGRRRTLQLDTSGRRVSRRVWRSWWSVARESFGKSVTPTPPSPCASLELRRDLAHEARPSRPSPARAASGRR